MKRNRVIKIILFINLIISIFIFQDIVNIDNIENYYHVDIIRIK